MLSRVWPSSAVEGIWKRTDFCPLPKILLIQNIESYLWTSVAKSKVGIAERPQDCLHELFGLQSFARICRCEHQNTLKTQLQYICEHIAFLAGRAVPVCVSKAKRRTSLTEGSISAADSCGTCECQTAVTLSLSRAWLRCSGIA